MGYWLAKTGVIDVAIFPRELRTRASSRTKLALLTRPRHSCLEVPP